jgi:Protein of unknown function (DUF3667)
MSSTPVPVVSEPQPSASQSVVSAQPAAHSGLCDNCGAPLGGQYCAACGQRHEPHVHTVSHFAGEAFESITHADSRLWRTLWFLLARPGRLTGEFFDGKRARYLPPFRLYLVISLLFFLVAGLPETITVDVEGTPTSNRVQGMNEAAQALETELAATPGAAQAAAAIRAQAAKEKAALEGDDEPQSGMQDDNLITEICKGFEKPDPTANRNYAKLHAFCQRAAKDRGRALGEAVVHNIPRAMFVFLPLLALVMKLMYWWPRRYYVEHLLFLVHNHAFVFLTLAIVGLFKLIPVVGAHLGLLEFAAWLYMIWYIFRAMRVYYAQSRGLTFVKYLSIGLAYFSTSLLVLLLTAIFSALTL